MEVFVCLYTHKHGTDVGVYKTYLSALDAAVKLMQERVDESWDKEETVKFMALSEPGFKFDYFHEVESNISYGERIEILARPVE